MSTFAEMSDKPDQWYVVTDRVMGGSSNLEADYDDGTFKTVSYTHLTLPTIITV